MERYERNGLCEYLKECDSPHEIRFYDTTKSLLVVARKKDNMPIMLIIDDRVSREEYGRELDSYEENFGKMCFWIANKATIPLFWIRYEDREILRNEDTVSFLESNGNHSFVSIRLRELPGIFSRYRISADLENRTPQKRKNDSLSSAFHIWQRECLRVGVFADIDLIRLSKDHRNIIEIMELKRSFYSLEQWRPFYFDLNNFAILANLCRMLGGIPFYVLYNQQVRMDECVIPKGEGKYYRPMEKWGECFYDKVDVLKVFQVEMMENVYFHALPYPRLLGTIKVDDWIRGEVRYRPLF